MEQFCRIWRGISYPSTAMPGKRNGGHRARCLERRVRGVYGRTLEIALPQYRPSIPGGSASRPSCRSSAPGDRMYVAYASSWNTSIYDLTTVSIPNYITHLNLAFVRPDTTYIQGSYAFDQAVAGLEFVEGATTPNGQRKFTAQQSQDLRNNIAGLRARGTKAFLSVGGWSYSQGSQWSRFNAKNIVDLALDLAAGVDIDWESSGATTGTASQFSRTRMERSRALLRASIVKSMQETRICRFPSPVGLRVLIT